MDLEVCIARFVTDGAKTVESDDLFALPGTGVLLSCSPVEGYGRWSVGVVNVVARTRRERTVSVRGSAAELYSRMGVMGNNSGDGAGSVGDSGDTRQSVDIRKGGFVF